MRRRAVKRVGDKLKTRALQDLETQLERSRLAREDTLCWASLSGPERRRLATRRSADARRWVLLTEWTVDALRHRVFAQLYLNICERYLFGGAQQVRRRGFPDV